MPALCDMLVFTEYKQLKLGTQLVDVITVVLVDIMSIRLFIEGSIIFYQQIYVKQIWVARKITGVTSEIVTQKQHVLEFMEAGRGYPHV